jgi:hypothetical protein
MNAAWLEQGVDEQRGVKRIAKELWDEHYSD